MSLSRDDRLANQKLALRLMFSELGDSAIDTTLFDTGQSPFDGLVLRTTWEELARHGHAEKMGNTHYRLTATGWLVALEVAEASQSAGYLERLGRVLSAMKHHVKGRKGSAIVALQKLAAESGQPEGWIFNMVDSRTILGSRRIGASWYEGARGRLVEIPVDFNIEPADIVSALTAKHIERAEELEARLEEAEEDRAGFYCPHCDAPVSHIGSEDFPEHHCIVTYKSFECGYLTGDDIEEAPCPYGPRWPNLEEFDFVVKQAGSLYVCHAIGRTERARRVRIIAPVARTAEEAEEAARSAAARKTKPARPS